MKRRLLSSIILVGGSAQFPGLREMLEERLSALVPAEWEVDSVEVPFWYNRGGCLFLTTKMPQGLHSKRKDKELNPCHLSWRGGAILAYLESTKDHWISATEWNAFGERYLHERAAFLYSARQLWRDCQIFILEKSPPHSFKSFTSSTRVANVDGRLKVKKGSSSFFSPTYSTSFLKKSALFRIFLCSAPSNSSTVTCKCFRQCSQYAKDA